MYVAIVIRYEDAKNLEEEMGRKEWLGGRWEEWRCSFSKEENQILNSIPWIYQ